MSSVYLLVSHGSRDPRPQIAVSLLAAQLSPWLSLHPSPSTGLQIQPIVATACLELADRALHQTIAELVQKSPLLGIDRVVILPLFLLPGVHVMDDIPREIELARKMIGDRVELKIAPYLGSYSNLDRLLIPHRQGLPSQSILLAHGSHRGGGNTIVEQLAQKLEMIAAYWSLAPSLADRVADLVEQGVTEIGILPYFLFPGGITDAIANLVAEFRLQFPATKLLLADPIGANPQLIETIGEILLSYDRN